MGGIGSLDAAPRRRLVRRTRRPPALRGLPPTQSDQPALYHPSPTTRKPNPSRHLDGMPVPSHHPPPTNRPNDHDHRVTGCDHAPTPTAHHVACQPERPHGPTAPTVHPLSHRPPRPFRPTPGDHDPIITQVPDKRKPHYGNSPPDNRRLATPSHTPQAPVRSSPCQIPRPSAPAANPAPAAERPT